MANQHGDASGTALRISQKYIPRPGSSKLHRVEVNSPDSFSYTNTLSCRRRYDAFTKNIGYPELLKPFAMVTVAHYIADLFADHGVYLTYIGKIKVAIPLVRHMSPLDRLIGLAALVGTIILSIGGMGEFKNVTSFITHLKIF